MKYRNRIGNRLMTGIIYGLILYILCLLIWPGIRTIFSRRSCYTYMKHYLIESSPVLHYLQRNGTDEEQQVFGLLDHFMASPLQKMSRNESVHALPKELVAVNFWNTSGEGKTPDSDEKGEPQSQDGEGKTLVQCEDGEGENEETQGVSQESVPSEMFQELPALQPPETAQDGISLPTKRYQQNISQMTFENIVSKYYTVVSATTLTSQDLDIAQCMNMDFTMKQDNQKPQILIYHTHGMEGFADSTPGDRSTGIVGVGRYLAQILREQYGYHVIHLEDSFDYVGGKLDRSKAYDYACAGISKVLETNPSIEVVIDLHRDGVGNSTHLLTEVNGKPTSQIMFFNGMSRLKGKGEIGYLYNPYRQQNLALSLQMKMMAEAYYPGFTRRNYIQAYQYNLHLRPKSMLIEAGAQTNTFQEVKNAMEPLAALLYMEFSGAEQTR